MAVERRTALGAEEVPRSPRDRLVTLPPRNLWSGPPRNLRRFHADGSGDAPPDEGVRGSTLLPGLRANILSDFP